MVSNIKTAATNIKTALKRALGGKTREQVKGKSIYGHKIPIYFFFNNETASKTAYTAVIALNYIVTV